VTDEDEDAHHTKIGEIAQDQEFHLTMPKHVLFFFCHQYNAEFRPLNVSDVNLADGLTGGQPHDLSL